jgi:hypothetical protein
MWKEMSMWVLIRVGGIFDATTPVKYLGREYLKVETEDRRGFKVKHPQKYLDSCTDVLGVTGCKALTCPGDNTVAVEAGRVGRELELASRGGHALFRSGVGKLQFILEERTDLAYCVKRLSQKLAGPTLADMHRLKNVFRYLEGTRDDWQYMTVNKDKTKFARGDKLYIDQFVDTDWAGDAETRKSTTSRFSFVYAFLLHGGATTQSVIAQSTGEAEYYGMGTGSADAIYVKTLLTEIGVDAEIRLLNDASAACGMANRAGLSKKLRHMHVKCLYVQELVRTKVLALEVGKGHYNPSDLGTKYFTAPRLNFLKKMVGLSAKGLEDTYGPRGQIRELPEFGVRAPEINSIEMSDVAVLVTGVQKDLDAQLFRVEQTSWALWMFLLLSWFAGFVMRGWLETAWRFAKPRVCAYVTTVPETACEHSVEFVPTAQQAADRQSKPPSPAPTSAPNKRTQTEVSQPEARSYQADMLPLYMTKYGERVHLNRGCRTLGSSADGNIYEVRVCVICLARQQGAPGRAT